MLHVKPKLQPHDHVMRYTFIPLIPKAVKPNHITIVRFFLTPVVLWLIAQEFYRLGLAAFLLTAFTDALDGSLARIRNQITQWGKMYDPVADKLLIGLVLLILTVKHFFYTSLVIVGIEITFLIMGWQWRKKNAEIQANVWGKIKMLAQVSAVTVLMAAVITNFEPLYGLSLSIFIIAIFFGLASLFTQGL